MASKTNGYSTERTRTWKWMTEPVAECEGVKETGKRWSDGYKSKTSREKFERKK